MVLQRLFISDTGNLLRYRAHWAYMVVLFRRCSWKGHTSVTLGRLLFAFPVQFSWETEHLLGERAQWVCIVVLERWSWNAVHQWCRGSLCMFIQVSRETEYYELVEMHSKDSLERLLLVILGYQLFMLIGMSPRRKRSLSLYKIFTRKMVL